LDAAPHEGEIPEITPGELKERMDQNQPIVLVDVREDFERDIADLPEYGQVRIPTAEFHDRMGELDPDMPTVVYCRSGGRSAWALQMLVRSGFTNVLNLRGGVLGWREEVDPSLQAY
jgi:sulfur-carrier protein adenylyltransferase/sulfurtransferase